MLRADTEDIDMTHIRRRGAVIGPLLAIAAAAVVGQATLAVEVGPPLTPLWETAEPNAEELPYFNLAIDPDGNLWASTPKSTFDIFDRDGNLLETWGVFGREEGQFDFVTPCGPRGGVAFKPDGGFYVSDSDNARIQEFDADRQFVRAWGSYGVGDDQFAGPDSIALDAAGNVYVNETCGNRDMIHVFDPEGRQIRTISEYGQGPFFGLDPDGTAYVFDTYANDLMRVPPQGDGEVVADLSDALSFPTGILPLPDGGFIVSSESSVTTYGTENVVRVAPDGTLTHVSPNGGWYLALDPAGDRFFISSDQLRAYALPD
jgi:sugar lactone lactonase YvrE